MNNVLFYIILFLLLFLCIFICFRLFTSDKKDKLFLTTKNYPEMKVIEDNWKVIRSEIPVFDRKLYNANKIASRKEEAWNNNKGEQLFESLKDNKTWVKGWWDDIEWYQFPLVYHNKVVGKAGEICPNTVKLLKNIPSIQIAGYAILLPKTKMPVHTDSTGDEFASMAANLALKSYDSYLYISPDDNNFDKIKHKDGHMVIFDSSRKHYAENKDLDNIRVILYIDFRTDTIFGKPYNNMNSYVCIKMHKTHEKGAYLANSKFGQVLIYVGVDNDNSLCYLLFEKYKQYEKNIKENNNFYLWNMTKITDKTRASIERSFNE